MLTRAEEQWAPADDPIFELVPPPFQEIVDKCYEDIGCPPVTIESFWQVYCDLRDRVDVAIPLNVVTTLNQSIFSEPGDDEDIEFSLAHLKAPDLGMLKSVEVDEDGGNEEGYIGEEYIDEGYIDEEYIDGGKGKGKEKEKEKGYAGEENEEDLPEVSFTMDIDIDQDQLF